MIIDFDKPIGDIVKLDYRTAEVFKKWQLNFCCGREMNLKTICESRQLDYVLITRELEEATMDFKISNRSQVNEWKIDFLIDFIIHVHHDYIYQALPPLKIALDSFALTHAVKFPDLNKTIALVEKLYEKLIAHNKYEDEIIFPYIKQMYTAYNRKEVYGNLFVRTLRKPLNFVEKEQETIDGLLAGLINITKEFNHSSISCSGYQVLNARMEELYKNLIQHQYLERKLLFPKAMEIEQKLLNM